MSLFLPCEKVHLYHFSRLLKIASWGDCRGSWVNETQFSSIAQSCLTLCNPMDCSRPGFPVHHQLQNLLKLMSVESVMPSSHLILFIPFSYCCQPFPASGSFPMSQFFTLGGQSIGVSASASVLPMNNQDWFPLGWTGWIFFPCSPRDSQESSPTPQFKSINSSLLSFLYSKSLTPIHDYWKNHSFD